MDGKFLVDCTWQAGETAEFSEFVNCQLPKKAFFPVTKMTGLTPDTIFLRDKSHILKIYLSEYCKIDIAKGQT